METEGHLQSSPATLPGGEFVILANVLSQQLNTFSRIAPIEYAEHIPSAHYELTHWVDEPPTARSLPESSATGLKSVFAEVFERPSITAPAPSEQALCSLYADVYSTIREVASDLRLFETVPPPRRRSVRDAIVSMFQGVFPNSRRGERVLSLSEAAKRATSKLERARERLPNLALSENVIPEDDHPQIVMERIYDRAADAVETAREPENSPPDVWPRVLHDVYTRDSIDTDRRPLPMSMPPVEADLGDRVHRIWYGTNRAPIAPTDPSRGFRSEQDDRVHYGYCHVFVPKSHEVGVIKTTWLQRIIYVSVGDSLEFRGIFSKTRDEFSTLLGSDLASWTGKRTGLVYVHGFNNTFKQAALTAAQIGCDLEVNGAISFFSWPSTGKLSDYFRDGETTSFQQFTRHFLEFVETLASASNLDRIDIVAHSMGNRILAEAIPLLATSPALRRVTIGHLVLAAPDISRVTFNALAPIYGQTARERVTLYTRKKDRALLLSGKLNGYQRIGFEPPPYCHRSLDTVSVSPLKLDFLSHGYFAKSRPVIEDLKRLLWMNQSPEKRNLEPVPSRGVVDYWRLRRI
jgi:esterase/lipase superfamily enzyme